MFNLELLKVDFKKFKRERERENEWDREIDE